jgi:hypothetical protein
MDITRPTANKRLFINKKRFISSNQRIDTYTGKTLIHIFPVLKKDGLRNG